MMWSTESSFNYLEYARLSTSPSSSSSSTLPPSPAGPSYQKDDDIQDVLSRGPVPLKAIYVVIVDTDEYPQCLMKRDDWDALASHFGVDAGFADACMNDGFASEGRAEGGARDGKVSFWNISRVARSNPSNQATTFLQLGTYVTFDLPTSSATFLVILRGKDPVALPCWYGPRPADDPFGVLASIYRSLVRSWALYFLTQDGELLTLVGSDDGGWSERWWEVRRSPFMVPQERSAVIRPESFDAWRVWGLSRVYTKCKAELKILERTLEFMRAEYEEYISTMGAKAGNLASKEMLRSYLYQVKKLIDQADVLIERARTLNSSHLSQNTLASNQATKQIAEQTRTLSQANTRDSVSIRTMAAIQLCFLPPTFVSAFFSMGFFTSLKSNRVWLFPAIALPLTLFTIATWYIWQRNRYATDTTHSYDGATSCPTDTAPAPTQRFYYDVYSRNVTPANPEKSQFVNGGATATGTKIAESLPQAHQPRALSRLSAAPGAGSSVHQTYFTGSSSVTLTKVQSRREEKTDTTPSGSDRVITGKPANPSPPQPERGLDPLDMPNLEKAMSSPSATQTTSSEPPPPESPAPSQHARPHAPPTQRASHDSTRNSDGRQQTNRRSAEAANGKSADQASVSAPSVAGSEWFTS
ncbi:MAG: hypothetical protein M1839_006939 [Geoglossum umbratile]|nr:MAG: hypothetical protein M1839_006939 [Geoglossum umbratile]